MSATALNLRLDPTVVAMDRRRGHRFQPPAAVLRSVPAIHACEGEGFDALVRVHYFLGGWDWWITELDPATLEAFGFVRSPMCPDGEWGTVDLLELATTDAPVRMRSEGGAVAFRQPVERDCYWQPRTLATVLA